MMSETTHGYTFWYEGTKDSISGFKAHEKKKKLDCFPLPTEDLLGRNRFILQQQRFGF